MLTMYSKMAFLPEILNFEKYISIFYFQKNYVWIYGVCNAAPVPCSKELLRLYF